MRRSERGAFAVAVVCAKSLFARGAEQRARIILSSAEGELNNSIAARLELTKVTVGKWRSRFLAIPKLAKSSPTFGQLA